MTNTDWLSEELERQNDIKAVIWDDAEFAEYVKDTGLVESLMDVSEFHAMLADQLRSKGVTSTEHSDWARRAIALCSRAKSRRQQLRTAVRNSSPDGWDIVARITAEVKENWAD